jgi:hypothetical protein
MKPGIKTTEFLLSLVALVAAFVLGAGWLGEGSSLESALSGIAAALAAAGYSMSRGKVKAADTLATSAQQPDPQ